MWEGLLQLLAEQHIKRFLTTGNNEVKYKFESISLEPHSVVVKHGFQKMLLLRTNKWPNATLIMSNVRTYLSRDLWGRTYWIELLELLALCNIFPQGWLILQNYNIEQIIALNNLHFLSSLFRIVTKKDLFEDLIKVTEVLLDC